MKDIAIILINYNSSEFTIQCVRSIFSHTANQLDYSIILVDNHSVNSEFEKLAEIKDLKCLTIIKRPSNEGFSSANMAAVKMVPAKYYYFLNNDTILRNDVLAILYAFMEKTPAAGICSGQMYHADGSQGINFNYFPDLKLKFLGSGFLRIFFPKKYPKKGISIKNPLQVPLLNGSSLFVRKKALDQIGGFDTNFFLYCEEEDLALRMKKSGYACYLIPEAEYIHFGGKSSLMDKGINYLMLREFYISQHYFYQKHYGKVASYIWRISQFLRTLRKFYIHADYSRLAFFILLHPKMSYSLRNRHILN